MKSPVFFLSQFFHLILKKIVFRYGPNVNIPQFKASMRHAVSRSKDGAVFA